MIFITVKKCVTIFDCGTVVNVLQKPAPTLKISANSLTTHNHQIEALSFFSDLLVRTIILKNFYLFFGVLAAFLQISLDF